MDKVLKIYGAGLAGCEAAWQAAERGVKVELYEMKPKKYTPAHHNESFAELVCSNSLRSDSITNAVGLLKEELRRMGSLIMQAADATRVPAGSALAVDRELFSAYITEKIKNHSNITVINEEMTEVGDGMTVIATSRSQNPDIKGLVKGLMIESYLVDGAQQIGEHVFGKSITDPCLGWEKTEELIYDLADKL